VTVVFFDLEMAGLELHHPIIQLAAVVYDGGVELSSFERKLKFDKAIASPEALEINHYSDEAWKDAVPPRQAVCEFTRWLDDFKSVQMTSKKGKTFHLARLSGYNAVAFDVPRLQKLFNDFSLFFPCHFLCLDVYQAVAWYFQWNPEQKPENLKLGTVCDHFGIVIEKAHDALSDVRATAQLAEALKFWFQKA